MAYEQRFHVRLQAQFQEAGARILHLEATLAQKDDHLAQKDRQVANLNGQIQRMMQSTPNNGTQAMTTAMQTQMNQATARYTSAENQLRQMVQKYNTATAQRQQTDQQHQAQIHWLQQVIEHLKKENMALRSSGGVGRKADMETVVQDYQAPEKQFWPPKKQNPQGDKCPSSAKRKAAEQHVADDDEDDEELSATGLKQEPGDDHEPAQSTNSSHENLSHPPSPQVVTQGSIGPNASLAGEPPTQSSPVQHPHRPSFPQQGGSLATRTASNASSANSSSIMTAGPRTTLTKFPQEQFMPPPPMSSRQDSLPIHPEANHRSRANAVDHSADDLIVTKVRQRKASARDDIKSEVQDLAITDPASKAKLHIKDPQARTRQGSRRSTHSEVINLCESPSPDPDPPTKRRRTNGSSYVPPPPPQNRNPTRGDIEDRMRFKAITAHGANNASFNYLDSEDDLADGAQALWEQIDAVYELWEEAKGEDWKYEFEVKLKNQNSKQCVSSKLKIEGRESGKSKWRVGGECLYACS
ncbi:hypothetical protein M409DRAFT_24483 [Zasmidium cellare ATCC 36951]|uniref:Uncharacterized protein n=1 Tax=Zasmidium cellare ATCC 36951 TaxID=1080233 RepID=A0A6A6CD21_ZASCE|nr:uncharacterized protein M409DRAFT_24483 [Zasmidium cellare ATCC 36951]KAF2165097.1 hypothetical protein M409DRAFT_24483 [Zasmidium cellare ATCC 36951]